MWRLPSFALVASLLVACASEERPPDLGWDPDGPHFPSGDASLDLGDPLDIESGLPTSRWSGVLSYLEDEGTARSADYQVTIDSDAFHIEFHTDSFSGIGFEQIVFDGGEPDWRDAQGDSIGRCVAEDNQLHCRTHPERRFQVVSTRAFFTDGLVWLEAGSLEGTSYERTGSLRRLP